MFLYCIMRKFFVGFCDIKIGYIEIDFMNIKEK